MLERVNENLFHMVSPFQPVGGGSPSKQPKFRSEAKIFPIYGGEVNMGDKETFCLCVLGRGGRGGGKIFLLNFADGLVHLIFAVI